MKTIIASLLLAASATATYAQKPGDSVTPETLGKLEWVKGEAPREWEPGKVYILECWATWCGPCLAAIPHVDELYDKYSEKGLRVIGVNVWEDGKDKVAEFVTKKGDGMSYPVAYTGKGGAFEKEWLTPAGVKGIPHAFVVKDGKVILATHPMQISNDVIEGLLAGGEAQEKVLTSIKEAEKKQGQIGETMQAFRAAAAKKDTAGMEKAIADLKALDETSRYVPAMNFELLVAKGDWTGVETNVKSLAGDPMGRVMVGLAAQRSVKEPQAPESFRKMISEELSKLLAEKGQPYEFQTLTQVQWSLGDKEAAKISAAKAADSAKELQKTAPRFPVTPFERYAEAVAKGELPTTEQVGEWTREAMEAAKAAEAAGETKKEG
ncbi:TlpA disulfide reductase family protein [Luteolibacter luteus]|uniref:TlpA family protein disulfide reductase n=1 Tax=Luteolibacter luteus TaxID=2728835 RepID=A0A858RIC8_9BACT|nr:TlpA disulfide reductase family protein [Luteolibacter luteus]QJE95813.1 TlpA family protein disulfide reductase [Luteolibacter luteus]